MARKHAGLLKKQLEKRETQASRRTTRPNDKNSKGAQNSVSKSPSSINLHKN